MNELRARADLVEVCHLAYTRGYITGTEGNFSIRLGPDLILSTPRGFCKGRLKTSDLVLTDLSGTTLRSELENNRRLNALRPSTELEMHLTAYKLRPDINAVAHAHPTAAVALTVAGKTLARCVLPETVCSLGVIPIAPYATPSTPEVSRAIASLITGHDALMLDHHGGLTVGADIWAAFYKMETLEHHARIMLLAESLGGVKPLLASQVRKLIEIRSIYGFTNPLPLDVLTGPGCCEPDPEKSQ